MSGDAGKHRGTDFDGIVERKPAPRAAGLIIILPVIVIRSIREIKIAIRIAVECGEGAHTMTATRWIPMNRLEIGASWSESPGRHGGRPSSARRPGMPVFAVEDPPSCGPSDDRACDFSQRTFRRRQEAHCRRMAGRGTEEWQVNPSTLDVTHKQEGGWMPPFFICPFVPTP